MRNSITLTTLLMLTGSSLLSTAEAKKLVLKTEIDSVSYAFGVNVASSIKENLSKMESDSIALSADLFYEGFSNTFKNEAKKIKLTPEQAQAAMMVFGEQIQAKMMEKSAREQEAATAEGTKFLTTMEQQSGVIKTKSGLLYKVLTEGNGIKPTTENQVTVHYRGTTIDGAIFDSSYDRGEPVTLGVTQVIPGWTEALQLMSVGAKYILYIPSELAYGKRQMSDKIKANSVLIFEIELLEIK